MKLHNWYTLGWGILVLLFIIWEAIGLYNRSDDLQPFTWFVRRIAGTWTSPMWYIVGGFLIWLIVHFLFVHPKH